MGPWEDPAASVASPLAETGEADLDSAPDVLNLLSRLSGPSGAYREVRRQQAAGSILARWPLLREVARGLDRTALPGENG
ncbi:MAG: BcsR/BcsP family cellulose biosynthesis protein [Candidatus Bathyarchaeota archaeon]